MPGLKGVLLIISGPSGVGKSTICRQLLGRLDAFLSTSATSRQPRADELPGRDYLFMSPAAFRREIERGGFLEYAQVYGGQYYGTPAEPVLNNLAAGRVVILEIEIEGTIQVVRRFPEAVTIYLLAPGPADQRERLIGRQMDAAEAVRERLSKADGEIRRARECGAYRHFLINDTIAGAVEAVERIVREKQQA